MGSSVTEHSHTLHDACSMYRIRLVIGVKGLRPPLGFGIGRNQFIFIILHFATSELTFISMLHELPLLKEHE